MQGILRVIGGTNTGSTYVLGDRMRLGRAPDADIQLIEPEVSRHHARIVRKPQGDYELTDLGSKAGTRVQGQPVGRHVLRPHETIAIGRSRFVFELMPNAGQSAACFSQKVRGFDVLRPTLVMDAAPPPPEPPRPADVDVGVGVQPSQVEINARHDALRALRDVLDYRTLRLQKLRGEPLEAKERARLHELSARLMAETHGLPSSRSFRRSSCTLPATLTQREGAFSRTLGVVLEDLSAGGARVSLYDGGVQPGDEVWLAFDLAALFSFGQMVVFRSRVVWSDAHVGATGLMFGGNALFVDTVEAAFASG